MEGLQTGTITEAAIFLFATLCVCVYVCIYVSERERAIEGKQVFFWKAADGDRGL